MKSTGSWKHQGGINSSGKYYGLSINKIGTATINGNVFFYGGSVSLTGAGVLQLDELVRSPGRCFSVSGDYRVQIGKVSWKSDSITTQPAQLAFYLNEGNQLQIGQFDLPEQPPARPVPLSLVIDGKGVQVRLDIQKKLAKSFPAGTHYSYQAAPLQLIANIRNGNLKIPNSAQLTQMIASNSCLSSDSSSIQCWYTSDGQSPSIGITLNPQIQITTPTAKPAPFAFQLQPRNRLHIKQFNLPATKEAPLASGIIPRAPIQITINGQPLDIRFDVKALNINHALHQSYLYQSAVQQSPVEMLVSGSSHWQRHNGAQLIQQLNAAEYEETNRMNAVAVIMDKTTTTAATNDNCSRFCSHLELPF